MQQIYLTGKYADYMVERAMATMQLKMAGYRLLPLSQSGRVRGFAMHLLTVPDAPMYNDVPCDICLSPSELLILGEVYERIAAPALRQAASVQAAVLIGGVSKAALEEPAFAEAVCACLRGRALAVVVADKDAVEPLRAMTPEEDQLWLHMPTESDELLSRLMQEISMRI